jgi:hypothetical protein
MPRGPLVQGLHEPGVIAWGAAHRRKHSLGLRQLSDRGDLGEAITRVYGNESTPESDRPPVGDRLRPVTVQPGHRHGSAEVAGQSSKLLPLLEEAQAAILPSQPPVAGVADAQGADPRLLRRRGRGSPERIETVECVALAADERREHRFCEAPGEARIRAAGHATRRRQVRGETGKGDPGIRGTSSVIAERERAEEERRLLVGFDAGRSFEAQGESSVLADEHVGAEVE